MGRLTSFIARTVSRSGGRVENDEHEVVEKLGLAFTKTFRFYAEIDPDGRELSARDHRLVRERLEANATTLRWASAERERLVYLARERNRDFRPVVEVVRMMQRSLLLAMSADALRRMRAISSADLAGFVKAQWDFLSGTYGLTTWENLPKPAFTAQCLSDVS